MSKVLDARVERFDYVDQAFDDIERSFDGDEQGVRCSH
jgi:hypothetical protein